MSIIRRYEFSNKLLGIFFNINFIIRSKLYKIIQKKSKELNGNLLDFGCGQKPYLDLFDHVLNYTGVDIQESGHNHLNSKIDVFYDGKKLPFNDNSFDSIFASEVLEHVYNIDEILNELNRVLKKNGKMLITIPFIWEEHEEPYDFNRFTIFFLKNKLNDYKFQNIEINKTGNYILVIGQLINSYLYSFFASIKLSFIAYTIVPIVTIVTLILNKILPSNDKIYLNTIVLITK